MNNVYLYLHLKSNKLCDVRVKTYSATPSVAAGITGTFVDLDLTAGASESRAAGTGVTALSSVATSGSIQTGLVMCAVVQIWRERKTCATNGD